MDWLTYYGVDQTGAMVEKDAPAAGYRLFVHSVSWMPEKKLQDHVTSDKFCYRDYLDTELFLCSGAGGENIDTVQVFEYIDKTRTDHDLHYVTIAADPYNIAGIQDRLSEICDTFILQNQSPKALSQYIEALSQHFKDRVIAYAKGREDIFLKAVTNSLLVRNSTGFYSIEKITLRADSNIRIDPLDAALTGFIACYIDFNRRTPSGDELVDDWFDMMKGR